MGKSLLIGNGVNRLDSNQSISWKDLLKKISDDVKIDLDNSFKPFPLAFEEILHHKEGNGSFEDELKYLKQTIRDEFEKLTVGKDGYNTYHSRLMKLGYENILTTNYDYCFELSVDNQFIDKKSKYAINRQESKHSLKRGYELNVNGKKSIVWHIHGELRDSRNLSDGSGYYHEESLMIGFEHYSTYFKKIQDIISGKNSSSKSSKSLKERLKQKEKSPYWIDKFFSDDIDIVGIGLDFSENHLWWLLNFRANLIRENMSDVLIKNTIKYYFANKDEDLQDYTDTDFIEKRNALKKSKAMADLLKAFYVDTVSIESTSYNDFYDKLISKHLKR